MKRKNEADAELKRQDASEALKLEQEMKDRVAQAERKVLALTKERDTLKKSFEKNRAVSDLVKEKDKIIDEVMKEGEVLSKKQSEMEGWIKEVFWTSWRHIIWILQLLQMRGKKTLFIQH